MNLTISQITCRRSKNPLNTRNGSLDTCISMRTSKEKMRLGFMNRSLELYKEK